jgi:hypothetical protein
MRACVGCALGVVPWAPFHPARLLGVRKVIVQRRVHDLEIKKISMMSKFEALLRPEDQGSQALRLCLRPEILTRPKSTPARPTFRKQLPRFHISRTKRKWWTKGRPSDAELWTRLRIRYLHDHHMERQQERACRDTTHVYFPRRDPRLYGNLLGKQARSQTIFYRMC